jgi:hypothetical protein
LETFALRLLSGSVAGKSHSEVARDNAAERGGRGGERTAALGHWLPKERRHSKTESWSTAEPRKMGRCPASVAQKRSRPAPGGEVVITPSHPPFMFYRESLSKYTGGGGK